MRTETAAQVGRQALATARSVVCAVVILSWSVALAAAQDDAQYETLISRALSEHKAGNFAEARALFLRAHEVHPSARTLRGLGIEEFELRNYLECITRLEAALASQERPLEGALRRQTEELLSRARTFVSRIELELTPLPGDVRILVDGVPAELSEELALALPVGEHEIEIRAEGYEREKRRLSVMGGQRRALSIELRPTSSPRPGPEQATLAGPGELQDEGSLLESPWLWTAVAVVVAGGVVTALLVSDGGDPEVADPIAGDVGVGGVVQALKRW